MRIACLQFNPTLGDVPGNIERAEALLQSSSTSTQDLDLLMLPELAFSGLLHEFSRSPIRMKSDCVPIEPELVFHWLYATKQSFVDEFCF